MEAAENEVGRAIFQELLWVHGVIRRDLETVRRLAADVVDGLPAEQLRAELDALEANGPLWQLRVNCLAYCRFVHLHHRTEDIAFFPAVRRSDPEVGPVVDRLEAEHRKVSDDLDTVETAARALTASDSEEARRDVSDALGDLSANLLAHLDFEELSIGPAVRRMESL